MRSFKLVGEGCVAALARALGTCKKDEKGVKTYMVE